MAMEEEEGKNVNTAKQLYDAFKSRDISTLLDIFTDDALFMDQHEPESSRGAVFTTDAR